MSGALTKQIFKQGSKIYDAIKSGRSKIAPDDTMPTKTPEEWATANEEKITDELYKLGKNFVEKDIPTPPVQKALLEPISTTPTDKNLEIGTNPALVGGSKTKNYIYEDLLNFREFGPDARTGAKGGNKLLNVPIKENTQVGVRINLASSVPGETKILTSGPGGQRARLQTVHKDSYNGKALSYITDATVTDVVFTVNQKGRQAIAAKLRNIDVPEAVHKNPQISVDGKYTTKRNVLEEGGDDIVEIGIDPINQHLFIDMNTGQAVKSADIATVVGSRVYAKGVKYWKKAEAPKPNKASDGTEIPSDVRYGMKEGGTITPFGDTFNYSTTTGLNKRYLEHYHGNVLDNNLQRIDEQGQTNTMLLSTVERDGKHYILPSYDPLTKSQMKTPQDILKLNQEAIDTGFSVGYPSEDIAEKELQKLRTTIIEDRNKLEEEELELYGDFDEEGNRRTYFDPGSEEQIEARKKRKLDEQMEKIKQRGHTSYGLATGGIINYVDDDVIKDSYNPNNAKQGLRFLLGQGFALGFGDEIEAFVRSKLGDKTYEENKAIIKEEMNKYAAENPLTAAGLEIAGGLTSAAGIYKTLGKAGLKQMAARGTAAGGIEGGIYGAGAPEVFGTDNRLAGSAIGTGIGASLRYVGEKAFDFSKNLYRTLPSLSKRNMINNLPEGQTQGSVKLFHTDSTQYPSSSVDGGGVERLRKKKKYKSPTGVEMEGGFHIPLENFMKDTKLSLAVDKDYSKTYALGMSDPDGTIGFLYEVSIPKKVLKNLFDPFNDRHINIFTKKIKQMGKEGKLDRQGFTWSKIDNVDSYIEKYYINPMRLKSPVTKVTGELKSQNYGILENKTTVQVLKESGFTGTWQKEGAWRKGDVVEEHMDQIQIFDGSSVDIIPENTKRVIRKETGKEDVRLEIEDI